MSTLTVMYPFLLWDRWRPAVHWRPLTQREHCLYFPMTGIAGYWTVKHYQQSQQCSKQCHQLKAMLHTVVIMCLLWPLSIGKLGDMTIYRSSLKKPRSIVITDRWHHRMWYSDNMSYTWQTIPTRLHLKTDYSWWSSIWLPNRNYPETI